MDIEKSKILKELGGLSEAVYDELVEEFIRMAESRMAELEAAVKAMDFESLRFLAHFLQGSSGTLRLHAVTPQLQRLEEASRRRESSEVLTAEAAYRAALAEVARRSRG